MADLACDISSAIYETKTAAPERTHDALLQRAWPALFVGGPGNPKATGLISRRLKNFAAVS